MSEKASTASAYAGSASAFMLGKFTMNEIAALVGIVIAIATFGVNLFFQWRRDQREQKLINR